MRISFSLIPDQNYLSLVLLMYEVLAGMKWHFTVILICIFMILNDDEHYFYMSVSQSYILFKEESVISSPNFYKVIIFVVVELYKCFIYLAYSLSIRLMVCIYFIIFNWVTFNFRTAIILATIFLVQHSPFFILLFLSMDSHF